MRRERNGGPPSGAAAPARSGMARRGTRSRGGQHGELATFRERLRALERGLAGAAIGQEALEAVHDLELALEEVEVTDEELTLQNEELLAVREELELQRHRYQDLFELAPDGYLVTGPAGVVHEANRAALDLFQTSLKAMRGKPFVVFVAEGERPRFRELFHRLAAGGRLADWEATLQRRDGSQFPAVLTVVHELGLDRRPELRWIVRDVTTRRETERALRESEERLRHAQRLESLGRLTGGIAHAFNNLMGAIGFHAELLEAGLSPEEMRPRAHLAAIEQAVERAGRLASQLLAFGRKQVLKPRRLSINAALAEMTAMLQKLLGERVQIETRLDSEAGEVEADLAQLEQVILNLVVNARDAMPGGGACRIETAAVEVPAGGSGLDLEPGRYARIAVADTGGGMSDAVKAHLFEPFFTTKERGQGSGLGLATVYGIVRQSGGQVLVESAVGQGTRVEVYLPQAHAEEPKRPAAAAPPRPVRHAAARGHEVILLVEDEDNIREPAAEMLQSHGYRVLVARSGEEALEVAAREAGSIHLAVTDVIMPGLSGGELAARLASARPETRILFISGYPEDAISHHGVLDPGKSFLQKPFQPGRFLDTVRQLLDAGAVLPVAGA